MLVYLICGIDLLLSATMATEFVPCKTGIMAPSSIDITGCDAPPCMLKKGSNLTWSMEFTANEDHAEIINGFMATYMGMNHGYPGLDGKMACDGLYSMPDNVKVGCPVQKGKMYRHETLMQHKMPTPKLTLPVKYSLKDKTTKTDFVCSELTITLS